MIYPQNNEKRVSRSLDGIWSFIKDSDDSGLTKRWEKGVPTGTAPMPVPAAFNEMTDDPELRDYSGAVWYYRWFDGMASGAQHRIRFGAAVYHADVYLNGEKIGEEHLGKLPFEINVTGTLKPVGNLLAVRVDTRLSWQTIPPGTQVKPGSSWSIPNCHRSHALRPEYHFDFLNYGGLLRSVWLVALPENTIESVTVSTLSDGDQPTGISVQSIVTEDVTPDLMTYRLLDPSGQPVASAGSDGVLSPSEPHAWSPDDPFLYTLEISMAALDCVRIPVGLRTVRVTPDALLLNGEPIYLTGCGLHEDLALNGQGHSDVRLVKDLVRLKQMGANSFRTAHYPYDEQAYILADQLGLLVIDELAAVGMNAWDAYPLFTAERINDETLAVHKRMVERLIQRDHHHPSVIMWSLANEVSCYEEGAQPYFEELFAHCRAVDPQNLPVTVVQSSTPPGYESHNSQTAALCDIVCWNRYYAWYQDGGVLADIAPQLRAEAEAWRAGYPDKPIMLTEFGADAVAGMHNDPPVMFSEEYQSELIRLYCETLDDLPFVIGEHVWNFADFMTKQGLTRVVGNRKGIHTRDRQPKLAAHFLKKRWTELARRAHV